MTVLVFTLHPSEAKLELTSGLGGGTWKEVTASEFFPVPAGHVQNLQGSLMCMAEGERVAKLTAAQWSNCPAHGNAKLELVVNTPELQTWDLG